MNHGTAGRELLMELQRGDRNGTFLASYNAKLVRNCLNDLTNQVQSLQEELQAVQDATKPSMQVRPSILLHNASIQRHKRCLLAYHKVRMDKMQKSILIHHHTAGGELGLPQSTNAAEQEFVQDYQQLRQRYAAAVFELDVLPPTSQMVQVRCLQALGDICLESSGRSVQLSKGSLHYVPRADVQDFLLAGTMELIDGEEVDF
jgi:GINS complex subunit 1